MKKILLAAALSSSLLIAAESDNIIQSSAYGEKIIKENKAPVYERENKVYYKDEVLFNYIIANRNMNDKPFEVKNSHQFQSVSMITKLTEEQKAAQEEKEAAIESITVTGYCNVSEDIHIGKQPSSAYLSCSTNVGYVKVFGNIVPKNELASVFYDPQYIEYKDIRYKVLENSITTNEARTSYNIATFVNDRKLAEIGYESTIASTNTIQSTTHEYLRALEQSKTSKTTDYITSGDNVLAVQNESTEKPDAADYIAKAGIDIVAGVIKTTAEVFKKDLPYLYEVKKNSKVFIDLKINKNGEKIK